MGPISVDETENSGVDGEESIVVVSSTFGDTLRFSLCDGSFIRESLKTPVGKVVKLLIGQVILGVQARRVSAVDDVPLGAFEHIVCPGSHRRVRNSASASRPVGLRFR